MRRASGDLGGQAILLEAAHRRVAAGEEALRGWQVENLLGSGTVRIDARRADLGAQVVVRDRPYRAEQVKLPFYRRQRD